MGRRIVYSLDWRQAEEVRSRRRAGETWRSIAERLGWRCMNAQQNIESALRRAPKPPADGGCGFRREAAVAMAEADPVLSRRCARCGVPNYRLRKISENRFEAVAVGFVRIGGRWHCPDCAPHPKPPTDFQKEFGAPVDTYRVAGLRDRP